MTLVHSVSFFLKAAFPKYWSCNSRQRGKIKHGKILRKKNSCPSIYYLYCKQKRRRRKAYAFVEGRNPTFNESIFSPFFRAQGHISFFSAGLCCVINRESNQSFLLSVSLLVCVGRSNRAMGYQSRKSRNVSFEEKPE